MTEIKYLKSINKHMNQTVCISEVIITPVCQARVSEVALRFILLHQRPASGPTLPLRRPPPPPAGADTACLPAICRHNTANSLSISTGGQTRVLNTHQAERDSKAPLPESDLSLQVRGTRRPAGREPSRFRAEGVASGGGDGVDDRTRGCPLDEE